MAPKKRYKRFKKWGMDFNLGEGQMYINQCQ